MPENKEEAKRLLGKYSGVIFPRWSDDVRCDWADPDFREYRVSEDKPINSWEDVARELGDFAGPRLTPTPAYPHCIEGAFERDGRFVFVVTNAVTEPWQSAMKLTGIDAEFESDEWLTLDPHSGRVEAFTSSDSVVNADFAGRQTLIFVSPKMKAR